MNLQVGQCLQSVHLIKNDYYRGIDGIEKGCEKLKDCVTEIINYKEKEMIPLTDEEIKFYKRQKEFHVCKKEFCYGENEKMNLSHTKKSEIIVITPKTLGELLIVFAI